jgi:hypothetical protein
VYSSVGTWVCVFDILIILHHIITSFRITLHHTSYCIDGIRIEYEANLWQMLRQNENVLRHEVSFGKYSFIILAIEGISFFTKHEKKGRCFWPKAKKRYVCKVSRIVKKYITVIYMFHQLFHTSNITRYSYNKVTRYYHNSLLFSKDLFCSFV